MRRFSTRLVFQFPVLNFQHAADLTDLGCVTFADRNTFHRNAHLVSSRSNLVAIYRNTAALLPQRSPATEVQSQRGPQRVRAGGPMTVFSASSACSNQYMASSTNSIWWASSRASRANAKHTSALSRYTAGTSSIYLRPALRAVGAGVHAGEIRS